MWFKDDGRIPQTTDDPCFQSICFLNNTWKRFKKKKSGLWHSWAKNFGLVIITVLMGLKVWVPSVFPTDNRHLIRSSPMPPGGWVPIDVPGCMDAPCCSISTLSQLNSSFILHLWGVKFREVVTLCSWIALYWKSAVITISILNPASKECYISSSNADSCLKRRAIDDFFLSIISHVPGLYFKLFISWHYLFTIAWYICLNGHYLLIMVIPWSWRYFYNAALHSATFIKLVLLLDKYKSA